MRANTLAGLFCLAGLAGGLGTAAQGPAQQGPPGVRAAHERALEDPFDESRFRAYLATLPRDGEFYVVEGDLLRTMAEVRAYLAAQSQAQSRGGIRPELLVNVHNGERDFYASADDRQLRYFVDRASFTSTEGYQRALTAMSKAAEAWQSACPECQIKMIPVDAPPTGPSARTGFIVRQHNAQGAYIAAAFFPHDPPARRVIRIDPSFFTTSFDSVGVLRHELGHVLGYRHEHTRGIPGCGFEDNRWQPLTPYDPHSVMHYFCGGGGSMQLDISKVDIAGHRALYGTPAAIGALKPPPGKGSAAAAQMAERFEAARRDPFDETSRQALLKMLPRVGEYYVVEGDIRMTESELTAYLAASAAGDEPTRRTPELLVNLHGGRPDFYPVGDARKLTYVVDRSSFNTPARYTEAVQAMKAATDEWEAVCGDCGIDFNHLEKFDANPTSAKANFTVRMLDAGGEFIAAAFFPHDPPARRTVDIDPSFYSTTFDKVGVLRHELGHVLGYRHEHIRGIPGCFREDKQWQPLTPYDPHSVMHYFCGGAGSLKLEISPTDRAGHHRLYDPPRKVRAMENPEQQSPPPPPPPEEVAGVLVVSFEGGKVVDNAAMALQILHDMKLLPVATHRVVRGDELASVYVEHLRLPSHSSAMTRLANQLNNANFDKAPLRVGETIRYPDVQFKATTFGKLASKAETAAIDQNWKDIVVSKGPVQTTSSGSYQHVELRAYELRIPIKNAENLRAARARISKIGPNVLAGAETPPRAARYYTLPRPAASERVVPTAAPVDVAPNGEEVSILGRAGLSEPTGERACQGVECPEIVLLDKPLMVHPDLKDAIPGENPDRSVENLSLLEGDREIFEEIDWDDQFHSTHLAGIIASRRNGFGLVGVDPLARVMWWNWAELSTQRMTVANKVAMRQREAHSSGAFLIYVFATSWPTPAYASVAAMMDDDGLAKRFHDVKPLVVAAAGEADPRRNQLPQLIELKTTEAPMNQGNHEYVIVVTGCNPCGGPGARLLPNTNFSPAFVHVAAPAVGVMSTVWGAKYSKADGTSQATAIVAGLASAMVARFPTVYKFAPQVKLRLQVSSTPIELVGNGIGDGGKLAAGIIDPALATRDPRKHWLKAPGGNPVGFDRLVWNVDTLRMTFSNGARKNIPTDEIWRIVTLNGKSVVYTEPSDWTIKKWGPGTLSTGDQPRTVLTVDGTSVRMEQIEDLLLKHLSTQ